MLQLDPSLEKLKNRPPKILDFSCGTKQKRRKHSGRKTPTSCRIHLTNHDEIQVVLSRKCVSGFSSQFVKCCSGCQRSSIGMVSLTPISRMPLFSKWCALRPVDSRFVRFEVRKSEPYRFFSILQQMFCLLRVVLFCRDSVLNF